MPRHDAQRAPPHDPPGAGDLRRGRHPQACARATLRADTLDRRHSITRPTDCDICASWKGRGDVGDLDRILAQLPVGALWSYTFYGTVVGAPEQILNTATLTLPADTTVEEPNPGNNSASDLNFLERTFADGFEFPLVNGPEGSVPLPTAALAPLPDAAARIVFKLDDKRGEVARVYARLHLGAVEYALATRGADGRWTLGPWTGYAVAPTLSWQAAAVAGAWQVTRVEMR